MPVTEKTYEQVALEDPDGQWELACGKLRSKPPTTHAHNTLGFELAVMLRQQLNHREFEVRFNAGRARISQSASYIPDVIVIPRALTEGLRLRDDVLESYPAPLPLVVEVWSKSTGDYDVETKFPGYKERRDLEIWRIHPYERNLTSWVLHSDGSYSERVLDGGSMSLAALSGVTVDLDELFSLMA